MVCSVSCVRMFYCVLFFAMPLMYMMMVGSGFEAAVTSRHSRRRFCFWLRVVFDLGSIYRAGTSSLCGHSSSSSSGSGVMVLVVVAEWW